MDGIDTALGVVGSLASIAGLILSVFVLSSVRKLRREMLFRGRLPELKRQLARHASRINAFMKAYGENIDEIEREISACRACLRSLAGKTNSPLQVDILDLIARIDRARPLNAESAREIWVLHLELIELASLLKNIYDDMKWGDEHGP